jgi:WD40 repeat protein
MEFVEVKLQVMLPEGSLTVTTVSLTPKFLFATDASQPNNLAFCYDIRTAKLKASALIPSLEPALRSIAVGDQTHVTSCADGVWFVQAEGSKDQLKVVRGMFGHFPKTSMACLAQAGDYVLSGGVDGYIYAWRIASQRCTKALKVHEGEITAMAVKNSQVVVASMGGRVKIYSYKVTKNERKTVVRAE